MHENVQNYIFLQKMGSRASPNGIQKISMNTWPIRDFKLSSPLLGPWQNLVCSESLEEWRVSELEDIPEAERDQMYTKYQKF